MYKVYQVTSGELLSDIANRFNVSIIDLLNLNGLKENQGIQPGMYLVVPSKPSNFQVYKIEKGDTLFSIASRHNISVDTLALINGLNKSEYIYPGETLLIPREGVDIYVTQPGDTLKDLSNKSNLNELMNQNDKIFILPNQLITYTKE